MIDSQAATQRPSVPPASTPPTQGVTDSGISLWEALNDLLRDRRSIRRYTAQPVPHALIEELLEAATWAPSSHNRQPWRFCVVEDARTRDSLADNMADAWRADLLADGMDGAEVDKRVESRRLRLRGAPVVVVPCLCMAEMDGYPDAHRSLAERTMGIQSVALASQNLLLAAHAAGLGACWMCAALFVPDLIREHLELPTDWEPQALITIGYPAESRSSQRAPLGQKVIWRSSAQTVSSPTTRSELATPAPSLESSQA